MVSTSFGSHVNPPLLLTTITYCANWMTRRPSLMTPCHRLTTLHRRPGATSLRRRQDVVRQSVWDETSRDGLTDSDTLPPAPNTSRRRADRRICTDRKSTATMTASGTKNDNIEWYVRFYVPSSSCSSSSSSSSSSFFPSVIHQQASNDGFDDERSLGLSKSLAS